MSFTQKIPPGEGVRETTLVADALFPRDDIQKQRPE
jgi:hypothetical protein